MTPFSAGQSPKYIGIEATAKIIEVQEFARVGPGDQLSTVFHYRTVFHQDGHVIRDVLSTTRIVENIIRAHDGAVVALDNSVIGQFTRHEKAQACAHAIEVHQSRQVEITGSTILVAI